MSEPFHIVERESFRVAGYCIHTTNKRKEGQKAIPRQWEELQTQGQQKELMSHMNQEPLVCLVSVFIIQQMTVVNSIIGLLFPAIMQLQGSWKNISCPLQPGQYFPVHWIPSEKQRGRQS